MRGRIIKRILIIAGLMLFTYLFIFGKYGLVRIVYLRTEIDNTERDIRVSSGIRDALVVDRYALLYDTVRIEGVIRSYGMLREGELCTVLIR